MTCSYCQLAGCCSGIGACAANQKYLKAYLQRHPGKIVSGNLADEPTGALDSKSGAQVMELFQRLNDEGVSVLMITHDADIAAHAKRVVTIKDGILQEKR